MKSTFTIIIIIYSIFFAAGYVGIHAKGKEKVEGFCKSLMNAEMEHIWLVPLLMPGEGNACLDFGYMPRKQP